MAVHLYGMLFSAPLVGDLHLRSLRVHKIIQTDLPEIVDTGVIQPQDPVSLLKPRLIGSASRFHRANDRRVRSAKAHHKEGQQKCQNKVKKRTGKNHRKPRQRRLASKGSRVAALSVLPQHDTTAAEGQTFDGVFRLSFSDTKERRPDTDGKLLHTDPIFLRQEKMSQLMYDDDHAENQYCQNNS